MRKAIHSAFLSITLMDILCSIKCRSDESRIKLIPFQKRINPRAILTIVSQRGWLVLVFSVISASFIIDRFYGINRIREYILKLKNYATIYKKGIYLAKDFSNLFFSIDYASIFISFIFGCRLPCKFMLNYQACCNGWKYQSFKVPEWIWYSI